MANPFIIKNDIPTAKLYEKAIITDLDNAIAYTDGKTIYMNTEDNLRKILPNYNQDMLKWLLFHEEEHLILRHHPRFMDILSQYEQEKFNLEMNEVNIIMDILVHDILSSKFPELIETAKKNLAQLRDRNSLNYTFKTNTLEKMIEEYNNYKIKNPEAESESEKESDQKTSNNNESKTTKTKAHKQGGGTNTEENEQKETTSTPTSEQQEEVDWSELDKRDEKEFIDEYDATVINENIARMKKKKLRLINITKKLNSMITSQRTRTYRKPSYIQIPDAVLKGSLPGHVKLALVFDASGSMSSELSLFKQVITGAVPQALNTPTKWFAGDGQKIKPYKDESAGRGLGYYEGKFFDMQDVYAYSGFNNDGFRTLELCEEYEQKGYSPIGVTDGGGDYRIVYYETGEVQLTQEALEIAKKLKNTVIVTDSINFSNALKNANPRIETILLDY